jgi:hypothetical protein
MEDDLKKQKNGRRPQTKKIENGRRPQFFVKSGMTTSTKIEDKQKKMEDDLKKMEDNLKKNGRQPQQKKDDIGSI